MQQVTKPQSKRATYTLSLSAQSNIYVGEKSFTNGSVCLLLMPIVKRLAASFLIRQSKLFEVWMYEYLA